MINKVFYLVRLVVRGGVESPTFRFSGASAASPHVAGCGPMGDLPAETVAGCRLAWPGVCRRWLPVWLPNRRLGVLPGEVGDAAGGREATEGGVSAVMVVDVQPGVKCLAAFGLCGVGGA
jgi:hypothetical protein